MRPSRIFTDLCYEFQSILTFIKKPLPLLLLILGLTQFAPNSAFAQEPPLQNLAVSTPRITQRIDDSLLARIPNSRPRALDRALDLGRLDGSTKMGPMFLVLKSTPEQEYALQILLDQQQDKSTPNYHRWLTPNEFGAKFGVDESDLQKITTWLESEGFTVHNVAEGRRSVTFSGTVAQIESSFHTEMHSYARNSEYHYSNNTNISAPSALLGVLSAVVGLDDFVPRPFTRPRDGINREIGVANQQQPAPSYTGASGHYLAPGDFAVIYNTLPLLQQGYDGTGVKIGIIGRSDINPSDVQKFRSIFLPEKYSSTLPLLFYTGTDPGKTADELEADLDVEWAGAVAPGAQVTLLSSSDKSLQSQAQYFVNSNSVDIISVSFSGCESNVGSYIEGVWEQAAAQGITVFVGAGDSGVAGCDATDSAVGSGYAVNGLASTPYDIAVGGTEFYENGNDSQYWTCLGAPVLCPSNPFTTMPYTSALRYIPETVWNESGTNGWSGISAAGGGVSTLYQKPHWQQGPTVPNTDPIFVSSVPGPHRFVPDVSLTAGKHDGYLVCAESQGIVGNCWSGGPASAIPIGGTSASAPALAGIQALINQANGRQGQANYVYYKLSGQEDPRACNSLTAVAIPYCVFNDITLGNNRVPCNSNLSGTICGNIPTPAGGTVYAFLHFDAVEGYDLASGLGSVNALNLFQQWNTATIRSTTTTLQITSPASGVTNFGQTITFMASVYVPSSQASSQEWGPPIAGRLITFSDVTTGQVLGTPPLSSFNSSGNNFTATFSTSSLEVGTHSITATFPGDHSGYYSSSTSLPVTVTVQQQQTLPTLTGLTINPSTVSSGNSVTIMATLSGLAPSGGAQISLTSTSTTAFPTPPSFTIPGGQTSGSSSPVVAGPVSNVTSVVVKASYNGSSQSSTLTVSPSANKVLTITLSASQTSVNVGQTVTLTATFSGATSGTPTGLAYFYDYFSGVAALLGTGILSAGSSAGQYIATYATSSLLAGQHALSVIYNGDSNYGSAISNVVNVTVQQQSQGTLVLSSLTINPSTIVGGYSPLGVVTLTGNAPPGGATVGLTSSNTHFVQVPPTVTVTPGYNNVTFPVTTFFTSSTAGATITASYSGTMYGAAVTVLPVAVSGVTFYPSSVTAGSSASFTVYMTGPAAAGTLVSLTSSDPSKLQVPSSVPLATGATSVSVTGTTFPVGSKTTVTVTANYNLTSSVGSLTVVPAAPLTLNTFNFSPATVTGGSAAAGTVTLTGIAPAGGVNVALSSSSSVVQVPPAVNVPAGSLNAPVTAQTSTVSAITNVTVTANYGGVSQSVTLTLVPPLPFLASLALNPTTVTSGSSASGRVTLTAPAPLGGALVSLTSNSSGYVAQAPASVFVPQGATSAAFTVTTSSVGFIAPITITVSYNGISESVVLTIVPPGTPMAPSSVALNPPTITSGTPSNGIVLLTGPAPTGGAVIGLSSDNPAVQVPLTIAVPPGANSTVFVATTSSVSSISTATITATLNGISQSTLLTLKPSGVVTPSNPVPLLTGPLVPLSQTPGGTGFTVTVKGAGFVPGAQVLWSGTALPTTVVSGLQVQASVPPTKVQTNESALVSVVNPGQAILSSNLLSEHLTYPTSNPVFGPSMLPVSGAPKVVAVGDFNLDGKLDLAVGKSDSLSIFLGNGDGTFGSEVIYPSVTTPALVVGDFNDDGKLDIAFNKSGPPPGVGTIGILLGNGDGTFTVAPNVSLPANPGGAVSLATGDFNGDGTLDLVVTGINLTQAFVLLGNGDGTFGTPKGIGSVNQPNSVGVADFNGDGKLDIALTDGGNNNKVAILLGNGDGTFQPQVEYPVNGAPTSLVVADFNGDSHPDIAVAENTATGVAVLLNNGNGTFAAAANYATGSRFYSIDTDDVNGDGKLDLVLSQNTPAGAVIVLLLGNGDGTFSASPINLGPSNTVANVALADLNGDGAPDVLAPSNTSGSLPILFQSIKPIIQAAPSNLSFIATVGGGVTSPISMTISNSGGGAEVWSASSTQPWVVLSQTSGTAPSTIMVSANPSNLSPGTYNATVTIAATSASNSPRTIPVALIVNSAPVVVVSLSFNSTALVGPGTATGTVTLSSSAPAGGAAVTLSSTGSAVQVPSTVSIPANLLSGTFTATAAPVTTLTTVTVTATYSGVSTNATLAVNPAAPAATLSASNLTFGNQLVGTTSTTQAVMLTNSGTASLAISGISIGGTSSGDFTIASGGTCPTGVGTLSAGSNCSVNVAFSPMAAGTRAATLMVSDNASGSPQTVTLTGIASDFSFGAAAGGSTSQTVTAGQTATFNLQINPVNAFTGQVALSCGDTVPQSMCTVSPSSATVTSSPVPFCVTVTTTAHSALFRTVPRQAPPLPFDLSRIVDYAMAILMLLLLTRLMGARKSRSAMLTVFVLILFMGLTSCGGGGGSPAPGPTGTPPGAYTIIITGSFGGASRSLTLSLTVK